MSRDDHVNRILDVLNDEIGLTDDRFEAIRAVIFVLLDKAILDGIRQAKHEATPSNN